MFVVVWLNVCTDMGMLLRATRGIYSRKDSQTLAKMDNCFQLVGSVELPYSRDNDKWSIHAFIKITVTVDDVMTADSYDVIKNNVKCKNSDSLE